jgi:hypothetical protein
LHHQQGDRDELDDEYAAMPPEQYFAPEAVKRTQFRGLEHQLTETYRAESSNASRDIAEAVEEAKRKFAALLTKAA